MNIRSATSGTLFAIKRYALHDGPDIRITVFFKGCPLSCWWCHNPEGMPFGPEIRSLPDKCIGCGACIDTCPQQALTLGAHGITRGKGCLRCGTCAHTCPALAHEMTGETWTVPQVLAEIEKELPFFQGNQGGVTFSGGEPLAQPEFLEALLLACGELGLHRAVDTSGFARLETITRIAEHADLFLFDIKHMDPGTHKRVTGVDNAPILRNVRELIRTGTAIQLRLPLIPGVNDDEDNLRRTAAFATSLPGVQSIDLLPYHDTARSKYRKLGKEYPGSHIVPATPESIDRISALLQTHGLRVRIGG